VFSWKSGGVLARIGKNPSGKSELFLQILRNKLGGCFLSWKIGAVLANVQGVLEKIFHKS